MLCRTCDEEVEFKDIKPTLVCPDCFKRFCERLNTCPKRKYGSLMDVDHDSPKLLVKVFANHQNAMKTLSFK